MNDLNAEALNYIHNKLYYLYFFKFKLTTIYLIQHS